MAEINRGDPNYLLSGMILQVRIQIHPKKGISPIFLFWGSTVETGRDTWMQPLHHREFAIGIQRIPSQNKLPGTLTPINGGHKWVTGVIFRSTPHPVTVTNEGL